MKPRPNTFAFLLAALLLTAAAGPLLLFAAPPTQPAKLESEQSVFVYPDNSTEGRDPFFPNSPRVYQSSINKQIRGPSLTDLSLRSILGTPPRVFAIINNHTFAPGDDGDVILKDGRRLHINCVNINPKAGTATVEANGLSTELHISEAP